MYYRIFETTLQNLVPELRDQISQPLINLGFVFYSPRPAVLSSHLRHAGWLILSGPQRVGRQISCLESSMNAGIHLLPRSLQCCSLSLILYRPTSDGICTVPLQLLYSISQVPSAPGLLFL